MKELLIEMVGLIYDVNKQTKSKVVIDSYFNGWMTMSIRHDADKKRGICDCDDKFWVLPSEECCGKDEITIEMAIVMLKELLKRG